LYLHIFQWPDDGQLTVPGLTNEPVRASLLADGTALKVSRQDGQLRIAVGQNAPDPIATVVVVDIDGRPRIVEESR
jgi:alpha-L-fucosidase